MGFLYLCIQVYLQTSVYKSCHISILGFSPFLRLQIVYHLPMFYTIWYVTLQQVIISHRFMSLCNGTFAQRFCDTIYLLRSTLGPIQHNKENTLYRSHRLRCFFLHLLTNGPRPPLLSLTDGHPYSKEKLYYLYKSVI